MSGPQTTGQGTAPLERGNFSSVATHFSANSVTNPQTEKAFSTWQARYAMCGHTLYRTASASGAILFLAARWGMVREMKSIEAVAAFFAIMGGKA